MTHRGDELTASWCAPCLWVGHSLRVAQVSKVPADRTLWLSCPARSVSGRQSVPSTSTAGSERRPGQGALPDARPGACRPPQKEKQHSRLSRHKSPGALMDLGCSAQQIIPAVGRAVVSVSRGAWSRGPALDPCQNLYQKRRRCGEQVFQIPLPLDSLTKHSGWRGRGKEKEKQRRKVLKLKSFNREQHGVRRGGQTGSWC